MTTSIPDLDYHIWTKQKEECRLNMSIVCQQECEVVVSQGSMSDSNVMDMPHSYGPHTN